MACSAVACSALGPADCAAASDIAVANGPADRGLPELQACSSASAAANEREATSELAFDDCFVPDSHQLSREIGDGAAQLRKMLAEIRIITGAMALGVARAALAEALRYSGERRQFGKPINRFQAIQQKLDRLDDAARHALTVLARSAGVDAWLTTDPSTLAEATLATRPPFRPGPRGRLGALAQACHGR